MDPLQTLIDADQDISNGDLESAAARLSDYHEWRNRGGFQPTAAHAGIRWPGSITRYPVGDLLANHFWGRIEDASGQDGPYSCFDDGPQDTRDL